MNLQFLKACDVGFGLGELVWCPVPMLLLAVVKEELNIFSLGLSPNLEAEEKMRWGVARGLESEMRSGDDLRRQARTLFPGQRRRSRRANQ